MLIGYTAGSSRFDLSNSFHLGSRPSVSVYSTLLWNHLTYLSAQTYHPSFRQTFRLDCAKYRSSECGFPHKLGDARDLSRVLCPVSALQAGLSDSCVALASPRPKLRN